VLLVAVRLHVSAQKMDMQTVPGQSARVRVQKLVRQRPRSALLVAPLQRSVVMVFSHIVIDSHK
jgi:hypothetical protein